ncbi:spore coat protein [Clostridium cadaveris]|uniref:spore coat protein n=1 Tax=Clostridium cadaveris TaxID=1529 RepID=UPI001E3BBFCF
MNEKEMINDYMAEINSSISAYGSIIAQTENEQLRQTIQGMRNQDEIRQYALFK